MKLIKKDKKGFTLVELIVVIAILAILALILIPAITGYIKKADQSSIESSARSLHSVAATYVAEYGEDASAGTPKPVSLQLALEEAKGKYTVKHEPGDETDDNLYTIEVEGKGDLKVIFDQNGNITYRSWDKKTEGSDS